MKTCTACFVAKPLADYYRHVQRPDGLYNQCKVCVRERGRLHYSATSKTRKLANQRRFRRTSKYGLRLGAYELMLALQEHRCAICDEGFKATPNIDHDHACCPGEGSCGNCVRGLLCGPCNRRLAVLDDHDWRSRAEKYLAAPPARDVTARPGNPLADPRCELL